MAMFANILNVHYAIVKSTWCVLNHSYVSKLPMLLGERVPSRYFRE